jgi:hypothetical protein
MLRNICIIAVFLLTEYRELGMSRLYWRDAGHRMFVRQGMVSRISHNPVEYGR